MENQELITQCATVAQQWLDSPIYDEATKQEVNAMLEAEDKTPLIDSFIVRLNLVLVVYAVSWAQAQIA